MPDAPARDRHRHQNLPLPTRPSKTEKKTEIGNDFNCRFETQARAFADPLAGASGLYPLAGASGLYNVAFRQAIVRSGNFC